MNLQFTNKGGNFVSEFEVTSDFNLHIEGVRLSDMHIYQKTAGGSYAKVTDFPSERSQDRVADFDFASLVYPKFIKVVCATEPTYAEIATDGEVTEIKSQSKEVEIVSNGVTEIAPDAGFGYLSGVKVNVSVPQSGGGEKYYFRCNYASHEMIIRLFSSLVRVMKLIHFYGVLDSSQREQIEAICIDGSIEIVNIDFGATVPTKISDVISGMTGGQEWKSALTTMGLTEITEEEFYNLEA